MNILKQFFSQKDVRNNNNNMLVNIVTPNNGWILRKIAENTVNNCKVKNVVMKTSFVADLDADVNYYCDLQNTYDGKKTKLDIGYLTHPHLDSKAWLEGLFEEKNVLKNLDGLVLMNDRYTKMCLELGIPKKKLTVITPGQTYDRFTLRKIVIGIVSQGGVGHGQVFMEDLFLKYDLEGFEFRFLGNGWDSVVPIAQQKNLPVELLSDDDYSIYPKFYHEIDYLLIPVLWTAGPMSFQEALASGTPVISSDVGFAGYEFQPDYLYPPGDTEKLYDILVKLRTPLLKRRKQILGMSWEKYAKDLVTFCKKMQILRDKNL